jgi:hypothetical protein
MAPLRLRWAILMALPRDWWLSITTPTMTIPAKRSVIASSPLLIQREGSHAPALQQVTAAEDGVASPAVGRTLGHRR